VYYEEPFKYTAGRTWKQAAGREVFCNNYIVEGDTLYMLESVGPVSAASAGDVDASKTIECPLAPDPVGRDIENMHSTDVQTQRSSESTRLYEHLPCS